MIMRWLGEHPAVVIAGIVAIALCLLAAMYFGYDLGWLPGLLARLVGR